MPRRSILTISTAACLYGVYVLYSLLVSPLFSPEYVDLHQPVVEDSAPTPPPPENRRQAEQYLADAPWAADAKYQLRTEDAFVYAEEWEPVEATGDVRFRPFALVWRRSDQPAGKGPIVVTSESALLKFAARFDISNPRPGRVVGGALEGRVRMHGPDGLALDGSNVNFSEQALKVWSDHPLAFRYGDNHGTGLGLEIDLLPGPSVGDRPGVSGMRTLRIRRDVVMHLLGRPRGTEVERETVQITSVGPFEYQLETHVATFQDQVRVVHPTGAQQADVLDQTRTLTIVFEPAAAAATTAPTVATEGGPALAGAAAPHPETGELTFRRLRAEGAPVVLTSGRGQLRALMSELVYDVPSRVATLRDGKQVQATQADSELWSPEITLIHDAAGDITHAVCRGAGAARSYAPPPRAGEPRGPLVFSAEWLKELRRQPAPDLAGQDLIELEGQVVVRRPGQMVLQGEQVKLWLAADANPASASAAPAPTPQRPAEARGLGFGSARPKRLLALQHVNLVSPQMVADTEHLDVNFEEGQLAAPAVPAATAVPATVELPRPSPAPSAGHEVRAQPPPRRSRASLERATGRTERQPIATNHREGSTADTARRSQPALAAVGDEPPTPPVKPRVKDGRRTAQRPPTGSAQPASSAGAGHGTKSASSEPTTSLPAPATPGGDSRGSRSTPSNPPAEPYHVTARVIRVRALQHGDQVEIADVWNEQDVQVTQEHEAGTPPFRLTGDRMHLLNRSADDQLLHVVGKPATIHEQGMQIEGPDIYLDRKANYSRVLGAGVLRLPVKNSLNGKTLDQPQPLEVWWKEQMRFDGLTAKFFVDVRATLNESRMRCQEMDVALTQRVSFSAPNPDGTKVEVQVVHCREGVDVLNYEYQSQRLSGVQRAQAWEFSVNQQSGATTARGPGSLRVWRRGNGRRAGLAPTAAVQANKPRQADTTEWEYTRVDFAGLMNGNTNDRVSTFRDRVRVVHGPVAHATDIVDPDKLVKNAGWMRSDAMQITQHPEEAGRKAYLELVGTGNAELEGRTEQGYFHALADSVSFDESKELYLLRSFGSRNATIWRRAKLAGAGSRADAQRMEFVPSLNQLKLDRSPGLDGLE